MNRYRLHNFDLCQNPESGDWRLLIKGDITYKHILQRAFPDLFFSTTFQDRHSIYNWGTYIKGLEDGPSEIAQFCHFLHNVIYLDDNIDECFALDVHTIVNPGGRSPRTETGQLVYDAKPYEPDAFPRDFTAVQRLADKFSSFIWAHPTYWRADVILAVPPSNPDKRFDLPSCLVKLISTMEGFQGKVANKGIRKVRATLAMKDCVTQEEKIQNIRDAFEVSVPTAFAGKTVIVVDDIYHSGSTIKEVGRMLKLAGARLVLGLVATKTQRDL
ncbi:hypothetical protein AY599_12420 [Leptolyngbya valderiana BDU 20041]|nr:hypothetical protein AY599_12420 [Leptolyngbya valderiana BDU 20041]